MFLDSVILILQEILEAAVLVSVMLVLTNLLNRLYPQKFSISIKWLAVSLLVGLAGAWLYAFFTPQVSMWFDYVGLEIMNASIQVLILCIIGILCFAISISQKSTSSLLVAVGMGGVVALSIIREVSEIILYLDGILFSQRNVTPVISGAFLAGGIGVSSGVLLYYILLAMPQRYSLRAALLLLALFAGNMASQACQLLVQADWLPYTSTLWDTSRLLPEYTVSGQLLFALVGYEASPSILQVSAYLLAALLVILSPLFRFSWRAGDVGDNQ